MLTGEFEELSQEEQDAWKQAYREGQSFSVKQLKESMGLLKSPKLADKLVNECHKKIVREIDTIQTILLFKCGELVENCEPTSYNLFLSEQSGVGKDHVLKNTLKLFPEQYSLHRAKTTPELLAYWHNANNEPDWSWNRKSLYLEEISNSVLNCDTFIAFTSQRDFEGTILAKQKPINLKINGKPVIFVTTASKNPKTDQLRRFAFASLDDSIDQTKAILKKQYEYAKKGKSLDYNPKITESLNCLQRVKVKIPFSEELGKAVLDKFVINPILRTTNQRFIDLIKSAAALHQYQREKDSNGFILADYEDYELARKVFTKISFSASTMPLTKEKKRLLEVVRKMGGEYHTVSEIEPKASFLSKQTLYNRLRELTEASYLLVDKVEREDAKGRTYQPLAYQYFDYKKLVFPTVEELKKEKLETVDNIETVESKESKETIESIETTPMVSTVSTDSKNNLVLASSKKPKIEDFGEVK